MKKIIIPFILFTMIAGMSSAQDSTVTVVSKNRYANFDFGVGYLHNDLSSINSFLSAYGYKPVTEGVATLSFSPSFSINRFVFRGEFTMQLPVRMQQSETLNTSFTGRHVAASIGYVVIQRPRFRVYPYIGINSFTSQLTVRERKTVTSVDDLVNNQQRAFHLVYSNASLDLGVQIDKLIPLKNRKWDCPQNSRYMTLGVRVGYLVGPRAVNGRFNGVPVEGVPTYSPNGPYLKLVIGFSTKMRDIKWRN